MASPRHRYVGGDCMLLGWGVGIEGVLREASFGWWVSGQVVVWCVWWPAWFMCLRKGWWRAGERERWWVRRRRRRRRTSEAVLVRVGGL